MKKYVPIVTDDPQDNVEAALNLVFIKDEEVYVRGYGPAPDFSDATLSNVTRDILQKYSPETLENVRLKDDLELSCATSEWLFDGIDTIEGVVALLYTMAWAFAETRERLRMYEETRLSPMDLKDRLIAPFQNDMFAMVWGAFKKLYPCLLYTSHSVGAFASGYDLLDLGIVGGLFFRSRSLDRLSRFLLDSRSLLHLFFDLVSLLAALLRGSLFHRAGGLHRPLGHLDADAVLARLKDDGRVVDLHDLADHTADGGDAVALFQAAAHLLRLLFALVFRTDDEEIEDRDHRDHEKKGFHNC